MMTLLRVVRTGQFFNHEATQLRQKSGKLKRSKSDSPTSDRPPPSKRHDFYPRFLRFLVIRCLSDSPSYATRHCGWSLFWRALVSLAVIQNWLNLALGPEFYTFAFKTLPTSSRSRVASRFPKCPVWTGLQKVVNAIRKKDFTRELSNCYSRRQGENS